MASDNEQKSPPSPASGQPSGDGMAAAQQGLTKPLKLEPIVPGFDPTSVRCAAESRLRELIFKDEDLLGRLKALTQGVAEKRWRVRKRIMMLTNYYRVDEAITPTLFRLGTLLTKILRIALPLDIFVKRCNELNAFCTPSHKGKRLIMCLHSSLVATLTPQELLGVMGHEAGHVLLGHLEIADIDPDPNKLDPHFSPMEAIRIRALNRAQEVSADRFGLLACQNIRVASSALFKVGSGLTEKWICFDEAAYARHFDELSSMAELVDLGGDWDAHPFDSLRVKALIAFGKSDTCARAFGKAGTAIPAAEMEQGVTTMLSVVDPDLSDLENAKEEEAANQFITNAALMLIAADGVVEPAEVSWLKAHTSQEWSRDELAQRMSRPDFNDQMVHEMEESAYVLVNKLSEASRAGLLHTICDAAMCGGSLPHAGMDVMIRICRLLEIRDEIATDVLEDSEKEHVQAAADNAERSVAGKRKQSTVDGKSPQPATGSRSRTRRSGITLADLVSKGSVALSDTLFATYKGESYVARLKKDDADSAVVVVYDKKPYDSVTAAAVAVTGNPVSGWEFWNVRSSDGKEKGGLKELREQLDLNDNKA